MPVRIEKDIVGVSTGYDVTDLYSRFFLDFPPGTGFYSFTKLEMPAGKLPRIFTVGADSLAQQQPVAIPDHDSYADMRSSVHRTFQVTLFNRI
jgi:hypothetical protein